MGNFISDAWDDLTGATAAGEAADAITSSTAAAMEIQGQMLDLQEEQFAWQQGLVEQQMEHAAPFQEAALAALGRYQGIQSGEIDISQDPALQYLQQQGQQQVETSGAARGTQLSGRTLEELSRTGQSIASQYRGQILGELGGLMGMGTQMGQQASGMGISASQTAMGQMGQTYGSLADLTQQAGAAQAAATMGAYQGFAGIVGGGLQALGGM